jgi:hypothetical protein
MQAAETVTREESAAQVSAVAEDPQEYLHAPEPQAVAIAAENAAAAGRGPRGRAALVVGALALAALTLAAAPVRSAAAGLLAQLRVNRVAAVAVGQSEFEAFGALAENMDEFVQLESVNGVPLDESSVDSVPMADAEAARELLTFAPRQPNRLGAAVETRLEPGGEYRLRVDGAKVAEVARALGMDTDGIPGEVGYVTVTASPGVSTRYRADGPEVWLYQMPSPTVEVPADWDLEALGRLYLTALGMSQGEAKALAATIEWGATLVVPIPVGEAEALDVRVDGVDGVLFQPARKAPAYTFDSSAEAGVAEARPSAPADGAFLVWQKDGMLYAISGGAGAENLVAIAEDLS